MEKYHIELTPEEKALVASIDFMSHTREAYLSNKKPIVKLMHSLTDRNGIPDHRWKHWVDPQYNLKGNVKSSNKEIFEKNGNKGDEVYEHPHFKIFYLPYMLYGPDLPDEIINEFIDELKNEFIFPESFTSGDHDFMWKTARRLARNIMRGYSVGPKNQVADEFYKLCLEIGFDEHTADTVRQQIMSIRLRKT